MARRRSGPTFRLGDIPVTIEPSFFLVVALFAFTHAWNEFLYALVFVHSNDTKTFTAGLTGLIMGDTFIWGQLMASSVIAIVPILIIYIVAQRYIVEGLAAGSVKG